MVTARAKRRLKTGLGPKVKAMKQARVGEGADVVGTFPKKSGGRDARKALESMPGDSAGDFQNNTTARIGWSICEIIVVHGLLECIYQSSNLSREKPSMLSILYCIKTHQPLGSIRASLLSLILLFALRRFAPKLMSRGAQGVTGAVIFLFGGIYGMVSTCTFCLIASALMVFEEEQKLLGSLLVLLPIAAALAAVHLAAAWAQSKRSRKNPCAAPRGKIALYLAIIGAISLGLAYCCIGSSDAIQLLVEYTIAQSLLFSMILGLHLECVFIALLGPGPLPRGAPWGGACKKKAILLTLGVAATCVISFILVASSPAPSHRQELLPNQTARTQYTHPEQLE